MAQVTQISTEWVCKRGSRKKKCMESDVIRSDSGLLHVWRLTGCLPVPPRVNRSEISWHCRLHIIKNVTVVHILYINSANRDSHGAKELIVN